MPQAPALKRELGLRDLVLFNFAAVAGIRWLAAAAHAGPGSLSLWVLAAALFFVPSALAVATLSRRFPEQGGIYAWTRHAFGDWHAFLCGWCYWLSNLFYFPSLVLTGVSMGASVLGVEERPVRIVAISLGILWIALLANLFGLHLGKWLGNLGGLSAGCAGALLILLGLWIWIRSGSATPLGLIPAFDWDKLNFWSQIAFAFGGLELSAILAGEIRDPQRAISRAAWISGLGIAGFYTLGTLAMLVLLPSDKISILTGLVQAASAAGSRLGIAWLPPALGALICASVTGQLSAWIAGSARIPYVIGIDRYFPPAFARLHPRWGTPHISILVQGAASTVFLLALQAGENLRIGYQLLVDMTVITYFIPFLYLFASAWKFGRRGSAASGLFVTAAAILLSLIPPPDAASVGLFELKLVGGSALLVLAGRFWFQTARQSRPG